MTNKNETQIIKSSKPSIDPQFIVELKGKEFVTYEGLLDVAHQKGLKTIETEIIQFPNESNKNTTIVKAICRTENGEYHGIGDAAPNSVNRMIVPHAIRMAETRAKARAMRDLTNIGMTAVEELGEDTKNNNHNQNQNKQPQTKKHTNGLATKKQIDLMVNLAKEKNWVNSMPSYLQSTYKVQNSKQLTSKQASEVITMLQQIEI